MPVAIYLHGFLSSPQSYKAVATQSWLAEHRPGWRFLCPDLTSYPTRSRVIIDELFRGLDEAPCVLGSSLGGFWATYVCENFATAGTVLINPAVRPYARFAGLVGQSVSNYHTGEETVLAQADIDLLEQIDPGELKHKDRYWLLAQTADETLDYRAAVSRFDGCKQAILEGGNHAFAGFDAWLAPIFQFFDQQLSACG